MRTGLRVREYVTSTGRNPFREWLGGLEKKVKQRIQMRLVRFEEGNLGDFKNVGDGVLEARLAFGPGYRIYFGIEGRTVVLLLCGGDKSTQDRDIESAKSYWKEHQEQENAKKKR